MISEEREGPAIQNSLVTDELGTICLYNIEPVPGPRTYSQQMYHNEMEQRRTQQLSDELAWDTMWDGASDKTHSIYSLLEEFISSLYDTGVDVSHFPPAADRTMLAFAEKLSKEIF